MPESTSEMEERNGVSFLINSSIMYKFSVQNITKGLVKMRIASKSYHTLCSFSSLLKFVNLKEKRYLKAVISYEDLGQSAVAVVLQELALEA